MTTVVTCIGYHTWGYPTSNNVAWAVGPLTRFGRSHFGLYPRNARCELLARAFAQARALGAWLNQARGRGNPLTALG
jgi:hypothetical protein